MKKEPPLQDFINGNDNALKQVYVEYRLPFINFARKFQLEPDEILDIYQDTIISMHENFVSGKVSEMRSSIKTYLFGIGKYKIYTYLRENKKLNPLKEDDISGTTTPEHDFEIKEKQLSQQQIVTRTCLEKMSERCRNILELFYYRGLSIDEIRIAENYENNNTVKSQKSRCLKKLKEMILDQER